MRNRHSEEPILGPINLLWGVEPLSFVPVIFVNNHCPPWARTLIFTVRYLFLSLLPVLLDWLDQEIISPRRLISLLLKWAIIINRLASLLLLFFYSSVNYGGICLSCFWMLYDYSAFKNALAAFAWTTAPAYLCQGHLPYSLHQGSSACQQPGHANRMQAAHKTTSPSGSQKNLSPWNWSLISKMVGTITLCHLKQCSLSFVIIQESTLSLRQRSKDTISPPPTLSLSQIEFRYWL